MEAVLDAAEAWGAFEVSAEPMGEPEDPEPEPEPEPEGEAAPEARASSNLR